LCNNKDNECPVKYRYSRSKSVIAQFDLVLFRLYECLESSEVYIECNNEEHADLEKNDTRVAEMKEVYGINDFFKDIINKIVRDNPHIKPMEIQK
jgi:hypothetical protein